MEVKKGYKKTEDLTGKHAWRNCDISDLCSLQRGFDITEATRKSGNIPVFSSSGLSYFHNEAKVQPPSVITGRKGILGKVFFVEEPCWPHDTTLWVKDFKGNDPRFVYVFLRQFRLERFDAATSVPTLNRNNVVGVPIKLPPLPEQRAIATALSDVDALLAKLDQLLAKKRDLKQAAMQELLTGKRRLPGFVGEWEERTMTEVCWFQEGPGVRNTQFTTTGIKLLNGTNIFRGVLNLENTSRFISENEAHGPYAHFLADEGDIVLASSGITIERLHEKVAFVRMRDLPFCMNTSTIRFKPSPGVSDPDFLFQFLTSDIFKRQIGGQATGSAQLNFGPSHVGRIDISIPPLLEQTAIAAVLSDMDAEIAALEARREKVRLVKQGMMQELLTGRIRLV